MKNKIEGTRSKKVKEKLQQHNIAEDKEVKKNTRKDKKQWFEIFATKAETEVSQGNMKAVYDITQNSAKVRQRKLNI